MSSTGLSAAWCSAGDSSSLGVMDVNYDKVVLMYFSPIGSWRLILLPHNLPWKKTWKNAINCAKRPSKLQFISTCSPKDTRTEALIPYKGILIQKPEIVKSTYLIGQPPNYLSILTTVVKIILSACAFLCLEFIHLLAFYAKCWFIYNFFKYHSMNKLEEWIQIHQRNLQCVYG